MSIKVTCISKGKGNHDDPHEDINWLGWINESTGAAGKNTRSEIVGFIEEQKGAIYVKDGAGNILYLGVVDPPTHRKYLRTRDKDGKWTDDLLALTECK